MFETSRLILRPTNQEDGEFLMHLVNTEGWLRFIGDRNIHSVEDAEKYIHEKMEKQFADLGYGNYTLIDKVTGYKIGTSGIYNRPGIDGVDIGFAMLPEYERKGYAYEAASYVLGYAVNELKLSPIQAITNEDNLASQALIEKLGLVYHETKIIDSIPVPLKIYKLPT